MAKTLITSIDLTLQWSHTNTPDAGGPAIKDHNTFALSDSLADGVVLDKADLLWHDVRILAAGTSEDIDISGGINDQFGTAVSFARIKGFLVRNQTVEAGCILEVGGAASNEWYSWAGAAGDITKVGPDGVLYLWNPSAAGFAVTAGTADTLKINNSGSAAVTYQIVLIGASA